MLPNSSTIILTFLFRADQLLYFVVKVPLRFGLVSNPINITRKDFLSFIDASDLVLKVCCFCLFLALILAISQTSAINKLDTWK